MAFVVKTFKTLRTNWKKSIFFSAIAAYGANYLKGKYDDSLILQAYCHEAKKFGEVPLKTGERTRKVTVFLNPAARNGNSKKLFEKNVAPLLYLAGMEVTVVRTEYEGQAKKYMEVLDNTDAIVVAGGDGTLSEVITGLLRREDKEKACQIPVGVIPLGHTNSLAQGLFEKGDREARFLAESAMSVIRGTTKPIDVMCITGDKDKAVYAVTGIDWGAYREAENRKKKYWYFGGLKHRLTYVLATTKGWPQTVNAHLSYQLPCEGCSRCYTPPPKIQWKWWHFFMPPKQEVPIKDYSGVTNEECGKEHQQPLAAVELKARIDNTHTHTQTQTQTHQNISALSLSMGPSNVSKMDFIKEGWARIKGVVDEAGLYMHQSISEFTLKPQTKEGGEAWYYIDNEQFEVMPIHVKLMRNRVRVFYQLQKPS